MGTYGLNAEEVAKMEKENKCCECGKEFKKGDLIIPRYDNPKLKMHMEAWKCKK